MDKKIITLGLLVVLMFSLNSYSLVICHTSDLHYTLKNSSNAYADGTLWAMNSQKPDVIVVSGDMANSPKYPQMLSTFETSLNQFVDVNTVVLTALGNNDNEISFIEKFGETNYYCEVDEINEITDVNDANGLADVNNHYRFIVINTNKLNIPLIEEMMKCNRKIIVCGHHPAVNGELLQLFRKYNVIAYLHGHEHRAKYNLAGGTALIQSGAGKIGYHNIITLNAGVIQKVTCVIVKTKQLN